MKKFVFKLFFLLLGSFLIIGVYWHIASIAVTRYYNGSTAEQIYMSFNNSVGNGYNCFFLGNSRIYRGINPDLFPSVRAYNFGHDNDNYNQMYYKLLYLVDNGEKIDYLIIGTDYYQFSFIADTRNYVYSGLFPKEYQEDYGDKSWFDIKEEYYTTVWSNKQNALLSCIKMFASVPADENGPHQKLNGQYVTYGEVDPNATLVRDYSKLDVQLNYFRKIISVCKDNNIELYVIMPPVWEAELVQHTDEERKDFDKFILAELEGTGFEENYINYSSEMGLSPYTDFIDVTHLNVEAADRYSRYINERIFGEED